MSLAYPPSNIQYTINDPQLALRIARHSPCRGCPRCSGLHPPPGVQLVLDDHRATGTHSLGDLGQYGSDDEEGSTSYLNTCACGHTVAQHGAAETVIGRSEFLRRGRVASRLDELLQDVGKLLDFSYVDDDIVSLRKQMRDPVSLVSPTLLSFSSPIEQLSQQPPLSPVSSELSDLPQRPAKKPRLSSSSLSDAEDQPTEAADDEDAPNDDDEDTLSAPHHVPPAIRSARSGKSIGAGLLAPSTSTKLRTGHTVPKLRVPPAEGEGVHLDVRTNGQYDTRIKLEDQMDEGKLKRLATGVTVDAATSSAATVGPLGKPEKAAVIELRKGVIQITAVANDKDSRSLVILTGLKTLFQKQLPKMPREYIARLVYDSNSKALAIIKRGYKVVGGICYRPFPHRGFAEIVFFATNSVDQEKGYGGMLMDHFKAHIRKTYPTMMHFLTYADNYAVGYFEKQGFSKDITLDRSVWAGYIKDYEGGTIMQCTLLPKVDYLNKPKTLAIQQEAVMTKIREMSRSHVVHPGITVWKTKDGGEVVEPLDPRDVPGLKDSGWIPSMQTTTVRPTPRNADHYFMERILKDLQGHPQGWPFLTPVNAEDVPDYYDVIKNPMDFSTMEHKLETKQYSTLDDFTADAQLVFDNCRLYNPEGSIYARNATKLEKFFKDLLADRLKRED
ncbi:hypothetical protein AMATHDRAFT_83748 [Amanita thiersii Skay4041]|uniref:histone acetyltransferase n=1 Tax=Amanita thiersii Skay4041 TaxID=703135 RepID=A0A2A9P0A6_9AGAR|nr:hypothetical protein AMATHDRAFT_83748 [Amanita thiersii Skay4041]